MPLTPKELIKKWELEHEGYCSRIKELQAQGSNSVEIFTAEADTLKACINELKSSVYAPKQCEHIWQDSRKNTIPACILCGKIG